MELDAWRMNQALPFKARNCDCISIETKSWGAEMIYLHEMKQSQH